MSKSPPRITIDVERAEPPISGVVTTSDRARQCYSGWTSLFSVLQRAMAALGTSDRDGGAADLASCDPDLAPASSDDRVDARGNDHVEADTHQHG